MKIDKYAYALAVLMLIVSGCQMGGGSSRAILPAGTDTSHELTRNPSIVLSAPQDWAQISLNGLKIGDSAKRINPKKISSVNEKSGWTIMRDANRYRVKDGTIDGLGMWDQDLISQLGIAKPEDIEAKFGKPEHKVLLSQNVTIYEYQQDHIHVMWNALEKRVVGINVTR